MLEKIFLSVLNMSFTASFVILLVIVARLFLKKAPKVFSYALWSVVLFRLICPFSFESVLSLLPVKSKPIPTDIIYEKIPQINTGIDRIDNIINPILPQATPQVSVNPMQVIVFISQIIWILGIICLLTYSIISLIKLKSSIKSSINTKSNIYLSDKIEIPFVLGVINPKIYL
ncbi:MAG: M56 family metallopeptidase, partial [Oscillospiraceae bacterium]